MLRKMALTAIALFISTCALRAETISGKVKSVDPEKSTITLTVGDNDQTLNVPKDTKIFTLVGKGKEGSAAGRCRRPEGREGRRERRHHHREEGGQGRGDADQGRAGAKEEEKGQ